MLKRYQAKKNYTVNKNIKKITRFATIYGVKRTLSKAFGRLRRSEIRRWYWSSKRRDVSIIGCGQFAFSSICYFIAKEEGLVFLSAYDTDTVPAQTLTNFYRFKHNTSSADEVINHPDLEHLFIVSNHASHTEYALEAMRAGIRSIHIEKPVATTYDQLVDLLKAKEKFATTLYAGYNRPYSGAVRQLAERVKKGNSDSGFSLNCFVSGHLIPEDHWYRQPEEGTRICGNMGHWLDLAIHILSWRQLPERFLVQVTYADVATPDDNITINLSTELGDIISLTLTARSEPFEGINETINFQYQDIIAKIDDFRQLTIWENEQLDKYRYFPKDVGHRLAVTQVFRNPDENRAWDEVVVSTLLMLFITDIVRSRATESIFNVTEQRTQLKSSIAAL
jgi:predicted dehydrogenase